MDISIEVGNLAVKICQEKTGIKVGDIVETNDGMFGKVCSIRVAYKETAPCTHSCFIALEINFKGSDRVSLVNLSDIKRHCKVDNFKLTFPDQESLPT